MRYLKYLTFVMLILGFFLLRPFNMQRSGLIYNGDDEGYLAHATSLIYFQFPYYTLENNPYKSPMPLTSVGPGIMASPFMFIGSLIDRALHDPIVKKRTRELLSNSWTAFAFSIATMFYFYLAFFLSYKGLLYHFSEEIAFLSILCMFFFQIFGLYIFRRPIFSHIYEFFLHSVCIFFLLKDAKTGFLEKISIGFNVLLGIIISLIVLVRYNNILFALMWPIVLFCLRGEKFELKKYIKNLIIIFGVVVLMIFLFKIMPMIYNAEGEEYATIAISGIFSMQPEKLLKRLWNVFFGIDFGILFTAPFALAGLIFVFFYKGVFKKRIIWLLFPLLVNLFFTVTWPGTIQGCWYGYRYFLFSLIPIVLIPFSVFINRCVARFGIKIVSLVLFFISVIPILSMFSFEGNNNTLGLVRTSKEIGWINPTYQLEIWKMIFFHPIQYLKVLFIGCPLYFVYVIAHLFIFDNRLPLSVFEEYPFSNVILIKVIIIFMFPLIMYWILKKYCRIFIKIDE